MGLDLNEIVDSLQDIFDEYEIMPPSDGGMEIEDSFYCFGTHEVCISVSKLNKKLDEVSGPYSFPGAKGSKLQNEIRAMIPVIESRTGYKFLVKIDKGRNYTHIFIKEKRFWTDLKEMELR